MYINGVSHYAINLLFLIFKNYETYYCNFLKTKHFLSGTLIQIKIQSNFVKTNSLKANYR